MQNSLLHLRHPTRNQRRYGNGHSMAISQHSEHDQTRWCPVCGTITHPHHLVCRHCGAIMLLSRSEQPGAWQRKRQWQRIRTGTLLLIGLVAVGSLMVGLYVTMNGIPGCTSNVPLIGAIECTRDRTSDRATFVSAALAFEGTRHKVQRARLACQRYDHSRTCLRATSQKLQRTDAIVLSAYRRLYTDSTDSCRSLLERWRRTFEHRDFSSTIALVNHINQVC